MLDLYQGTDPLASKSVALWLLRYIAAPSLGTVASTPRAEMHVRDCRAIRRV
jgi:hypothetical protein